MGAANGAVATATGVFMLPVIPYIQALGLDRDDLVQAQGISFSVSTFALTLVVLGNGTLNVTNAVASLIAMLVTFVGMFLGQYVRKLVRPEMFRFLFFCGMLVLGVTPRLHSLSYSFTPFKLRHGLGHARVVAECRRRSAPAAPAWSRPRVPRPGARTARAPMKCGSRSASSSVAMTVTQQSAAASTGRHSLGGLAGDDGRDRSLGRRRIAAVVDELRAQARSPR